MAYDLVAKSRSKPSIFVLMPFKRELDNMFYALKEATSAIGANVERADSPITTEIISQRIYNSIETSDLILADLTDKNPNVFYEVGYAHALGKPVAFLAPDIHDIPFDLRAYPVLTYAANSPILELVEKLKPYLASALQNALDTSILRAPVEKMLRSLTHTTDTSRLFKILLSNKLKTFANDITQWSTGTLTVGPEETRQKGIEILRHLTVGGFATLLVPVESYWLTGTDYLEAARQASRVRGKKITRVFIVFDESSVESHSLKECITKDNEAGIETLICFASKMTDRGAIRDFGIWDDEILCSVEVISTHGTTDVAGCSFTIHRDQINLAYRWMENILSVAEPAKLVLDRYWREEPLRQPLVASAGIMAKYAEQYCKGSYLDRENCKWYHGSWLYLRQVNMVSTPDWHKEFYKNSISQALACTSSKRILICGTADYCMLAHVIDALPEDSIKDYEIVVLDLCNTPLRICEWYSNEHRHLDVGIRTLQGNALHMDFRDGWFGLVITDAFLTRFNPHERKQVVSEWARVLAPGGFVVTTVRVEQGTIGEKVTASEKDIQEFLSRTKSSGYRNAYRLTCTVEQLTEMAQRYAEKIVSFPLNESQLPEFFSGFQLNTEFSMTSGEFKPTRYARIIAKKPELSNNHTLIL